MTLLTTHTPKLLPGPYDAALIDLDGTLVDTLGDFVAAVNAMLADLPEALVAGIKLDAAAVGSMVGKGAENLVKKVLNHVQTHTGLAQAAIDSGATYAQAYARYQHHYGVINGRHARVYAGVREGLQALQAAGLPLVCLTNKPRAYALQLLKLKALDGFFAEVFGGDSFERKKPDPLPLRKACEFLGTLPGRTLMVGDSSNDAQAARAAGCPVWLVTYGYNHGQPVSAVDADGWANRLDELVAQALNPALPAE